MYKAILFYRENTKVQWVRMIHRPTGYWRLYYTSSGRLLMDIEFSGLGWVSENKLNIEDLWYNDYTTFKEGEKIDV